LTDYFDDRGSPRFRRLGLAFAAKQHPQIQGSFGSRMDSHNISNSKKSALFNARAHHLAADAIEKDAQFGKKRNAELFQTLGEKEKHREEDVKHRQLDMLFSSVPDYAEHQLPGLSSLASLLPLEADKEDELRERRAAERHNSFFMDPQWIEGTKMDWLLTRKEILRLDQLITTWTRAGRGSNCVMWMDRPSFCRFILDAGLVDEIEVPYFWAVSLFDDLAQPMRICPPDATWAPTAPVALVVNRWLLMAVFDTILRQHYDEGTKHVFLGMLSTLEKKSLPPALRSPESGETRQRVSSDMSLALFEEDSEEKLNSGLTGAEATKEKKDLAPWLQPPERPVSSLDMKREGAVREHLIASLLVEPEVVHMATKYRGVFKELHSCYCDADGHMSFPSLLQFCSDFRLTPSLMSLNLLQATYESVQSVEVKENMLQTSQTEPLSARRKSMRAKKRWSTGCEAGLLPGSRSPTSLSGASSPVGGSASSIFGVGAFTEALCKLGFVHLGFYGNTVQQSTTGYVRMVWLLVYLRNTWASLRESLSRDEVHQGHVAEDSEGMANEQTPPSRLDTALRRLTVELWNSPSPSFSKKLRNTVIRPKLGIGHSGRQEKGFRQPSLPQRDRRSSLGTRSFTKDFDSTWSLPAGPLFSFADKQELALECQAELCIEKGACRLCDRAADPSFQATWGDARCRGCSIVDALPFDAHPFKPLLREWPGGVRPTALLAELPVDLGCAKGR